MDDIIYNQVISFTDGSIQSHKVIRAFVENGNLILLDDDLKKIVMKGRSVETGGKKERIDELISMAKKKEINIPPKPVIHYARKDDTEYVLLKY